MRTLRYRTAKQEMNDISKALQSVGSMSKQGGNPFIEIKRTLEEFYAKITILAKSDSPLLTLAGSLEELLQLDFQGSCQINFG